MLAKPFNRSVAESLLRPTGTNHHWVIDDRGIWLKAEWNPALGTGNRIDFEFDSWRPAVMVATDSLPQAPGDLPALPFPFDAKDLASFMLYGFGALVADHYGDWENGPNPERIDDLNPLDFSRRAVKEAFEAYREAQRIVDPYPLELDAKAERARKAWKDADSVTDKETKDALDLKMEATAAEAKAAQGKWLEAMVRALLKPAPVTTDGGISLGGLGDKADSDQVTPENLKETSRKGSDAAIGMTTREIGAVFDGLPFKQENWPKRVTSAKWLHVARLALGAKGGASAMWCPLKVAQAIHNKADNADKAKTLKTLNNRFKKNPALRSWLDAWDDFHSIFSDSD